MNFKSYFETFKIESIQGRYLNLDKIVPIIQNEKFKKNWKIIGHSVENRPVYMGRFGQGKTKILMWSQMHGNESTTTKGLLDFLNLLQSSSEVALTILEKYSFCIIPMLNPDGSEYYTRANANNVDLNRDFQSLTQPESKLLMQCYKDFKPDYCYNLHDQRSIFGVGTTGKPASISFLAPSFNVLKDYNEVRLRAVNVIMKMVDGLSCFIPQQIGRFNDEFNINCVGDTFQSLGTPTILIEAGHFSQDYEREETRKFVFIALLSVFYSSSENDVVGSRLTEYLNIPQNIPNYFDFVYKNVAINYEDSIIITNFAVQFKELLVNKKIHFNGIIAKVGDLDSFFGHVEMDCQGLFYRDNEKNIPQLDENADFFIGNELKFVKGLVK